MRIPSPVTAQAPLGADARAIAPWCAHQTAHVPYSPAANRLGYQIDLQMACWHRAMASAPEVRHRKCASLVSRRARPARARRRYARAPGPRPRLQRRSQRRAERARVIQLPKHARAHAGARADELARPAGAGRRAELAKAGGVVVRKRDDALRGAAVMSLYQ